MMRPRIAHKVTEEPVCWLSGLSDEEPVAVSTRIRLARNLVGFPFPDAATLPDRQRIFGMVTRRVREDDELQGGVSGEMNDFDAAERDVLLERRLITRELSRKGAGSGVLTGRGQNLSVMINEEDHLRLQTIQPGLQLSSAWRCLTRLDDRITAGLDIAFRDELGFLTACPTNVGTGIRASLMFHVQARVFAERLDEVVRAAEALGLAARGLLGEGTEPSGGFLQISNQSTLGETEATILARLQKVVRRIIWYETNTRLRLVHHDPTRLYDLVGRAYGQLRHARRLGSEEAVANLSALRLGAVLGMFRHLTRAVIDDLSVDVQPGHMQAAGRTGADPDEQEIVRATLVRKTLARYTSPT